MKCPLCKGKMFTGTTILPFDLQNRRVVVVLNVSALICGQCGDEYVEMHVARRVEKILERVERDGISMGFVEYSQAA